MGRVRGADLGADSTGVVRGRFFLCVGVEVCLNKSLWGQNDRKSGSVPTHSYDGTVGALRARCWHVRAHGTINKHNREEPGMIATITVAATFAAMLAMFAAAIIDY
jgi:hypothetical protein